MGLFCRHCVWDTTSLHHATGCHSFTCQSEFHFVPSDKGPLQRTVLPHLGCVPPNLESADSGKTIHHRSEVDTAETKERMILFILI